MRHLEEENRRLKSIVADQALDLRALKDVLAKKRLRPAVERQLMVHEGPPMSYPSVAPVG